MRRAPGLSAICLALVAVPFAAHATTPVLLSHQGYLLGANDEPVTSPSVGLGFSLWSAQSLGTQEWPASGESACVADVQAGYYTVLLDGSLGTGCGAGLTAETVASAGEHWLQLSINGTLISPRVRVSPAPVAALATALTSTLGVAGGGTGATDASTARTNLGAASSGANADITSITGLTTALTLAQGGTGATNSTTARTNLGAASSGANADITSITGLTTALTLAQGGTGANLTATGGAGQFLRQSATGAPVSVGALTATDLPTGIDAAKLGTGLVSNAEFAFLDGVTSAIQTQLTARALKGANSDITSLSGLTTALTVGQGGIGTNTLGTNGVLVGNGTNAITSVVAASGGLVLTSNAGAAPTWQAPAVSTPSNNGFSNRFRNGTFDIWQRGYSGSLNSNTSSITADGWTVAPSGASLTWDRVPGRASTAFGLRLTGGAGLVSATVAQRLESYLTASLYPGASAQVTVQAKVYNGSASAFTPTLTVRHPGVSADAWNSTTGFLGPVSLQSCAPGVTTTVAYTFASPVGAQRGLEVMINFGTGPNGASIETSEWDIRVQAGATTGLNASPAAPELRPIDSELALCQRYFASTFPAGVAPANNAGKAGALTATGPGGGQTGYLYWQFPRTMRATPTVTTYNPLANNSHWRDLSGSDIAMQLDPQATKGPSGVVMIGQFSGSAVNAIHATASAEL